jgi:hypothetical protein
VQTISFSSPPFSNNVDVSLDRKAKATKTPARTAPVHAILFHVGIHWTCLDTCVSFSSWWCNWGSLQWVCNVFSTRFKQPALCSASENFSANRKSPISLCHFVIRKEPRFVYRQSALQNVLCLRSPVREHGIYSLSGLFISEIAAIINWKESVEFYCTCFI